MPTDPKRGTTVALRDHNGCTHTARVEGRFYWLDDGTIIAADVAAEHGWRTVPKRDNLAQADGTADALE